MVVNDDAARPRDDEPLVKKAYYSIGDVCELTGLKPHVLRYWETQFPLLHPSKNRAGNRVFRPKDIELVLLVKHLLYERKYTIEGANRKLKEMRKTGDAGDTRGDVTETEVIGTMRDELLQLKDVLTLPIPG